MAALDGLKSFQIGSDFDQEQAQKCDQVQITLLDEGRAFRANYERSSREKRIELLQLKLRYELLKASHST